MASTLYARLHGAAVAESAREAVVVTGGPSLTHQGLELAVEDVAAKLLHLGIQPGQLVSLAYPNTIEFVVLFLGITRARAVAAPLNSAYTEEEFKFYMEDAQSVLLLLPREGGNARAAKAAQTLGIRTAYSSPLNAQGLVELELAGTEAEAAGGSTPVPAAPGPVPLPEADDVALFLHTSGTTSRPKGVPLTHANLSASLGNIIGTYDLSPSDRSYLVMPLFHVHGLMAALLSQLAAGGTVILPIAGRFSASVFWDEVEGHRASWYTAVPTMHQILLSRHRSAPRAHYPALRFIRSCSASLAKVVLEELEEVFKAPVLEAYAMTEASHQMTSNPLPMRGPHKASSVGKPTGIELAILDDKGTVLPANQRGEVCIRGPNVTKGYRSNPKANEEAFLFGWFHTGDQGFVDEEGYLFLTGRLKELINRGGEKISPLEVDAALLTVPGVAEAVAFSAPDSHYGEEVNAAIVPQAGADLTQEGVQGAVKASLAAFKIPKRIFFVAELPRTATGKIQRRFVAEKMLSSPAPAGSKDAAPSSNLPPTPAGSASSTTLPPGDAGDVDAPTLLAQALARLGVRAMFGVVGIPVTAVATAAQAAGIRYIGFRNEQAAGYAAAAFGFLTGTPGVLLTVSGPGCVHGLAGLSHAAVNTWPLVMVSGSCSQADFGKGDFQELDQVNAVRPFAKYAGQASRLQELAEVTNAAVLAAVTGRPGGAYIDVPADVLHEKLTAAEAEVALGALAPSVPLWEHPEVPRHLPALSTDRVREALTVLRDAERPLLVVGMGAGYWRAEGVLREFVEMTQIPFVPTPMGKGVLPDTHPLCAGAARSLALAKADVALVVGAPLNWLLHFGEPPKWDKDVKFILVDVDEKEIAQRRLTVGIVGSPKEVVAALIAELKVASGNNDVGILPLGQDPAWREQLQQKASANAKKMVQALSATPAPLNFHAPLRVLKEAIAGLGSPAPILVSEGANTMDLGRAVLDQSEARTRIDAATWGTMGVGLGYAVGAALAEPERLVVALEGDSAFGFSGMEVETIARYKLPVVIIIMNNSGVYGGDRRPEVKDVGFCRTDPAPTDFVPNARYDLLAEALGAKGYNATTVEELNKAVDGAFAARLPAVINVVVDPFAGVESGRMTHKN